MSDFKNIDKLLKIAHLKEDTADDVLRPHSEEVQNQRRQEAEAKAQEEIDKTFDGTENERLLSRYASDSFLNEIFGILVSDDTIDAFRDLIMEVAMDELGPPPSNAEGETFDLWFQYADEAMWSAWDEFKSLIKGKLMDV